MRIAYGSAIQFPAMSTRREPRGPAIQPPADLCSLRRYWQLPSYGICLHAGELMNGSTKCMCPRWSSRKEKYSRQLQDASGGHHRKQTTSESQRQALVCII